MADRNGRIRIFEQTMEVCGNDPELQAAIKDSIEKQKIIWEEDTVAAAGNGTGCCI